MMTEFFMPMKPPTTTHQEKQVAVINGKPVFYEPEDLAKARAKLMAHLSKHVPAGKLQGALRFTNKWCFPLKAKHKHGDWKTTKPDVGNMSKLMMDCMTKLGYWKDDAYVSSLIEEKFWSETPGIYIKIEELN